MAPFLRAIMYNVTRRCTPALIPIGFRLSGFGVLGGMGLGVDRVEGFGITDNYGLRLWRITWAV